MGPFQDKGADCSKPICGRSICATRIEVQDIARDASRGVKCKSKVFGKAFCLLQYLVDSSSVRCKT